MRFFKHDKSDIEKLFSAIQRKSVKKVKSILENSNNKNEILELNIKNKNNNYPIERAVKYNNIEIVNLLIEHANQHQIILKLNEINNYGNYPLLKAVKNENVDMVNLLINYANQHQITLEMNGKDEDNFYPLLRATSNSCGNLYNSELFELLIKYASEHHIILELNEQDRMTQNYPLLSIISCKDNIKMIELLLDYVNEHHIVLELNKQDKRKKYPLLKAIKKNNNVDVVKLLIEYANQHQIDLELNKCDKYGNYPLLEAIKNDNNTEIVKLLIAYANQHHITLELNRKNKNDDYPIASAIKYNNTEVVNLLIEYANQHYINLELNDKDYDGYYPLTRATTKNNTDIAKSLIKYAKQHQIILKYHKYSIKKKPEISTLIQNYEKEKEEMNKNGSESIERRENLEREKNEIENSENDKLELENATNEIERQMNEYERLLLRMFDDIENRNTNMEMKQNESNNNDILPETPTLVIVTNNFDGERYDHLDVKKDEFLIITNWNIERGWVYGHRKNNEEEKGIVPEVFVKVYDDEVKEEYVLKNQITPEYRMRFEDKVNQLRSLSEMNNIDLTIEFDINRDNIIRDAFDIIMFRSPELLKRNIKINYIGEDGLDFGGLLRDFFYQISKEIGNQNYGLFQYSNDNSYELEINPYSSIVHPNYLEYYRFIGRIIGLAILNKQHLSLSFTLPFYKRLLNKSLKFSDLEDSDPQVFKNLQYLINNTGVEELDLDFTQDIKDCFGNYKTIELKPDGKNINVTDSNKNEYINLMIQSKLNNPKDKEQLDALKQGFYEIIPQNINSLLDEIDLKYLISGINVIDVDDWENNTDYEGYDKNDITIIYFWECVRKFSNENLIKLLVFATGNSQVPVTGFKDLQGSDGIQHFKLKKIGTEEDLPISHTCFNRIDLPPYTSYTKMRQKLLLSISEGVGAFTMG